MNDQKELNDFLREFITQERYDKFRKILEQRTRHLCIVLEDIFQSHNASAVLRSCDCFGIQDVHIIENQNTYKVNPDIALGASKWVSITKYNSQLNNSLNCIRQLKNNGYTIAATSPHNKEYSIENLPLENKVALVFGTEMQGISDTVAKEADCFVNIPMYGFTESFNISVSAALCLYELSKRLRSSDIQWQISESEKQGILTEWIKNTLKDPENMIRQYYKKKSL